MQLNLNNNGTVLRLRLRNYKFESSLSWCRSDYSIHSRFLDYHKEDIECLKCFELNELCDALENLLSGRMADKQELRFIMPDFSFVLYPTDTFASTELIVWLWDSSPAFDADTFHIRLNAKNTAALLCYLKYVRGEIGEDDGKVQQYLSERVFISDHFVQGTEFLFILRDFLASKGMQPESAIDDAVKARAEGKQFDLSEHIRGLIYSLLTNQTPWIRIVPHLPEIDKIFFNYDAAKLKSTPGAFFEDKLRSIKCGNRKTKAQMDALHENISVFEMIEQDYGSMDAFVTSAPANEIVDMLSKGDSKYKLKQVGNALAWEYLRNMGIDGAKPDIHLRRFFGKSRMAASENDPASISEVLVAVSSLSQQSGLSMATIDNLIWSFCADGYGEICTASPRCTECVIKHYCKHYSRDHFSPAI